MRANAFVADGDQTSGDLLGTFGDSTMPFVVVSGAGGSNYDLTPVGRSGFLDFDGVAMAEASCNALRASAGGTVTNSVIVAAACFAARRI